MLAYWRKYLPWKQALVGRTKLTLSVFFPMRAERERFSADPVRPLVASPFSLKLYSYKHSMKLVEIANGYFIVLRTFLF